jgi:hypothetical protein
VTYLDVIIADAPRVTSVEDSPSKYSIAAWISVDDGPPEEQPDPLFDLYDAERDITARVARVRRVPTPERAAELLERYGSQSQAYGIASGPVSRW